MPFGTEHPLSWTEQPLSGPGTDPTIHTGAVEIMRQIRRWNIPDEQPVTAVLNDVWFLIDGGGTAIVTPPTTRAFGKVDFPSHVTGAWLLADQVGSVTVDILQSTYDDFPTFASITGGVPLVLAGAQKYENVALDGTWTTNLNRGDILRADLSGVATIQLLLIVLRLRRLDLTAPA